MSNIGLNSNVYHLTGKYLNMLNDFVVKTKSHQDIIDVNKAGEIISFFSKINDEETVDPQIQLLSSIIERELRVLKNPPSIFLTNLIKDLENKDVKNSLPKIEFIIEALDNEHFEALAKIKGE